MNRAFSSAKAETFKLLEDHPFLNAFFTEEDSETNFNIKRDPPGIELPTDPATKHPHHPGPFLCGVADEEDWAKCTGFCVLRHGEGSCACDCQWVYFDMDDDIAEFLPDGCYLQTEVCHEDCCSVGIDELEETEWMY